MTLSTNKGDIGTRKLTEIEVRIFGADCRGGKCRAVKMKEHLPFSRELSILFIEGGVVADVLSNSERDAALKDSVF